MDSGKFYFCFSHFDEGPNVALKRSWIKKYIDMSDISIHLNALNFISISIVRLFNFTCSVTFPCECFGLLLADAQHPLAYNLLITIHSLCNQIHFFFNFINSNEVIQTIVHKAFWPSTMTVSRSVLASAEKTIFHFCKHNVCGLYFYFQCIFLV